MDELIMALTRRGRGARMPLHHPALTAAGQLWCHNRAEGLLPLTTRHLSTLPRLAVLSSPDRGPAAATKQLSQPAAAYLSYVGARRC